MSLETSLKESTTYGIINKVSSPANYPIKTVCKCGSALVPTNHFTTL